MNDLDIKEKAALDDEDHIIDIAASSSFCQQNEEYNNAYKKWRSDKRNTFAFNYVDDTREHTYLAGVGFIDKRPDIAEKTALCKNMSMIGIILIITLSIETFGKYILTFLFKLCGCTISFDIISGLNCPNEYMNILFTYIIEISKRIIPFFLFIKFIKLPGVVLFPTKIINSCMHKLSVPSIMIVLVVGNYLTSYSTKLFNFLGIRMTYSLFHISDSSKVALWELLLFAVVVPVLRELCLRGVIMQSLRQFGDGFALIVSSIISAFMIHDFSQFGFEFVAALTIGYFVLRSGSILTGIIMHIFLNASICLYYFLVIYFEPAEMHYYFSLIQLLYILVGFLLIILFSKNKTGLLSFNLHRTYITTKEKLLYSVSTLSISAWLVFVFVLTIISLNFKE